MSVMACTCGSFRASLLAGISPVPRTIVVWLAWLVKNFMTSTASAGFCAYAPSIRVLTPTKGDAGLLFDLIVGSVARP